MLWSACRVNPPGRCKESFDIPMINESVTTEGSVTTDKCMTTANGSMKALPYFSMLATLVLVVAALVLTEFA